jgi:penicillin-binding protein 1C
MLVLRVDDGSVAAYVGNAAGLDARNADPRAAPWVDCASSPRSSGSILKPFLYAAMIDSGELSPSRLVPDIPTRVGSYSPENNLKTYSGAVRADEALARSLNVPFVRLLRGYGVERFASLLGRLGFSTLSRAPADYGLTLILGGAEVSLVDAASAYASLASAAKSVPGFTGATWRRDTMAGDRREAPFSAGAAWLTLEALVDVARPGDEASWQEYASSRRVAWKTGTSFGSRDAWALGATSDWVVAIWAGNADGEGRPELKGTDAAAPVLFNVFQTLPRSAWFERPAGALRYETVCADSGFVAGPDCVGTSRIAVPAGARTDRTCPYCRLVHLSDSGAFQVRAEGAEGLGLRTERRFVLPPAMEWYFSRSTTGYRPLPPWAPGMEGPEPGVIEFMTPEEGSSIFVPIELDGSPGMAVFRAAHHDPKARLFWHLDGDFTGKP